MNNSSDRPEPLAISGAIAAGSTLTGAGIALAVAFGAHLTDDQVKALLGFVAAIGPIVTAVGAWRLGRSKVTPVDDPRDDAGRPLVAAPSTPRPAGA